MQNLNLLLLQIISLLYLLEHLHVLPLLLHHFLQPPHLLHVDIPDLVVLVPRELEDL